MIADRNALPLAGAPAAERVAMARVLFRLDCRADWVGVNYLAERCCLTVDQVRHALRDLAEDRCVSVRTCLATGQIEAAITRVKVLACA